MTAGPTPEVIAAMRSEDGSVPLAMLLGDGGTAQAAASASPINYVNAGFPPTILFNGTDDFMVSPAAGLAFHQKLLAAGVPSELHLVAGVTHEFDATPSLTAVCVAAVSSFVGRYVVDPQRFADEVMGSNPLAAATRG
jgi:acetyl esterase/lipase